MVQFTQVELNGLKETIVAEAAAVARCQDYTQHLQDPELRQLCSALGDLHQSHLRLLTSFLGPGAGDQSIMQ